MRASFFDYDPSISGFRYIVLTEEDPKVETAIGSTHEEGWSRTSTVWELDGDIVTCTTYDDGRDCDGRTGTTTVVACAVANLAAHEVYERGSAETSETRPLPFRVPAWDRSGHRQRDYSAEAAGY